MNPRLWWLLTSAVFVILSAAAPALAERQYQVEVRGGLAIAKLRDVSDPLDILQSVKSFTGGVGMAWPMGRNVEVVTEVLYVEKGISFGESEGTDQAGNPTGTFESMRVNKYVEVPVLLRWSFPTSGAVRPVLFAGPYVGFEVAEQLKLTGSQDATVDDDILNDTDFGLVLGTGLAVKAGRATWVVDARYDLGLADLGSFYASESVKSGAFAFTAGIRF